MRRLSWQKAKPLTEIRRIDGATLGRVQIQKREAGASDQADNEQRAATPGHGSALHDLYHNFDQTGEDIEYAADRLQQEADHDNRSAKQCAADRNEWQMRRINILQQLDHPTPLPLPYSQPDGLTGVAIGRD